MSGTQDVVIASGVESMSRVPMGMNFNHCYIDSYIYMFIFYIYFNI